MRRWPGAVAVIALWLATAAIASAAEPWHGSASQVVLAPGVIAAATDDGAVIARNGGVWRTEFTGVSPLAGFGPPWTAVSQIAAAGDPVHGALIAVLLRNGTVLAKQGLSSPWMAVYAGGVAQVAVASDPVHGPLICVRLRSGAALVKEGGLSADWKLAAPAGVAQVAVAAGPVIALLMDDGSVLVNGRSFARGGVAQLAVAPGPVVALLLDDGSVVVNGRLVYRGGVAQIAVAAGPLIAWLLDDGSVVVNGRLVYRGGVAQIAVAPGPAIALLMRNGTVLTKDAGGWTTELASPAPSTIGPGESSYGVTSFLGTVRAPAFAPWAGAQCLNTGVPQGTGGVYWGTLSWGVGAAEIDLPRYGLRYPREACHLYTAPRSLTLPADSYIGMRVYVPADWTIPNAFPGVNIAEYHFTWPTPYFPAGLWGAPVTLELHPASKFLGAHVTLALETGTCVPAGRSNPGCDYRSNADDSLNQCPSPRLGLAYTCIPPAYADPPGGFDPGAWNEIVIHVHWASDLTGQIQTWYRVQGSVGWTPSADVGAVPTVQTLRAPPPGCCSYRWTDYTEAYTSVKNTPTSVWLGGEIVGTGFGAVASALP